MRKIKIMFLTVLCIGIVLPLCNFNFQENYVSPIDNRMLTEWDLQSNDIIDMVENYVNDRIGFRTAAIDNYTELNDKVYSMMIHPTYTYGKDGYVFFRMGYEAPDPGFYDLFCGYLRKAQDYCEERGVPFVYCLNPSKTTVYQEYLPKGYIYENKINKMMYEKLEEYGIHYVSNEKLLREKSKTEQVFNVKYDAGHWNDLGAFYGTNHLLEKVSEYIPSVHPREKEEFEIGTIHQSSLPVSHFEIDEEVPVFYDKNIGNIEDITENYSSLELDINYNALSCLVNHQQNAENLPRVLVFQGSYYNGRTQYMQSAFQEYDAVHNYQNFINLDYYFNVFQPDCVILESAEYATNGSYFSYDALREKKLNPKLDVEENKEELQSLTERGYTLEEAGSLLTIITELSSNVERGYLIIGKRQFDFLTDNQTHTAKCTIDKKYFQEEEAKVFFQ